MSTNRKTTPSPKQALPDKPLDSRRREAHPEIIVVGARSYERDDVAANKYGESRRSANRRDPKGAPYAFFGGVKYRPQPDYDDFIAGMIQRRKPQPLPKRRSASSRSANNVSV